MYAAEAGVRGDWRLRRGGSTKRSPHARGVAARGMGAAHKGRNAAGVRAGVVQLIMYNKMPPVARLRANVEYTRCD